MLKNVPKALSSELLMHLDRMGHNDTLVIGDGNFPGSSLARQGGAHIVYCDGVGTAEMMDAILAMIPVDIYVEKPIVLMQRESIDKDLELPLWDEITTIVERHDKRGKNIIDYIGRFDFYNQTKDAYVVIQTGEEAKYGCVIIRKGVITSNE